MIEPVQMHLAIVETKLRLDCRQLLLTPFPYNLLGSLDINLLTQKGD
jgi:hypothetical protein